MRKIFFCSIVLCFIIIPIGFAEQKPLSSVAEDIEEAKKVEKRAEKPSADEEKKRQEMRKKIEEKKAELNGTSWKIQVGSQSGKGDLMGSDDLTFQDEKFISKKLQKRGFPATNYTLTVQTSGSTVWETMQTSAKEGVAFWRGEWLEDSMSGVINRQLEEGNEEYYFSSAGMSEIPDSSAEEKEEGEAGVLSTTELEPTLPPAADTGKIDTKKEESKTKRSWFY